MEETRNRTKSYYQIINNALIGIQEFSTGANIQLYKTIFGPITVYASESWTILNKHRSKLAASEMIFLRRVVGKSRNTGSEIEVLERNWNCHHW